MRSDWIKTYLANEISLQYGKALPKNDRLEGDYPVFGSNGVVGFHNEALVKGPGIIVGRKGSCGAVHFSTSDFWPIDTTYYIGLRKNHDWRFMAFFLSTFGLCAMNSHSTIPGLNRENVYKLECLLPPLPEQQKIAAVLFKIQQAIEVQESIIERLQELKKSTMQHVFTYGLREEKTKETEIGRVAESWEVGALETLCVLKKETCAPNECQTKVYIGLEHIESGRFFLKRHGSPSEVQSAKHQFTPNDILYGKLRPYLDKAVVVNNYGICSTDILVLTPVKDVPAVFIVGLLHLQNFLDYAIKTTGGLNHPRTSWASLKDFVVPLPTVNDQLEIAHILKTLEEKIDLREAKKFVLQDLFKTMLNKLMAGEIRVRDLEVDIKEIQ